MKPEKNYGIDLLRIISMLMIVVLHCLGQGGILKGAAPLSVNYCAAWLLEIMAFCAVNCFALISGYVGYDKKVRYANLFYLVLQTTFYSVLIAALFRIFRPETVNLEIFAKSLVPIAKNRYWYVTAYFCMFFFTPFLNQLLAEMERGRLKKLLYTMILVFSILPTICQYDIAKTKLGYSMIWLSVLYLMGGYIRKYGFGAGIGKKYCLLGYWIGCGITWGSFLLIQRISWARNGEVKELEYLVSYTSPVILSNAVCLLLYFSKCRLRRLIRPVAFFSPAALGVYLIHTNSLPFRHLMKNMLSAYAARPLWEMAAAVVLASIGIWLLCSLLDRVRLALFQWVKVRQCCAWLENKLQFILIY